MREEEKLEQAVFSTFRKKPHADLFYAESNSELILKDLITVLTSDE